MISSWDVDRFVPSSTLPNHMVFPYVCSFRAPILEFYNPVPWCRVRDRILKPSSFSRNELREMWHRKEAKAQDDGKYLSEAAVSSYCQPLIVTHQQRHEPTYVHTATCAVAKFSCDK